MATDNSSYTSPKHKLLNFFHSSRDKWKAKCLEAKATIKTLKNRIRFLERSKEEWKEKAKQREAENTELKARWLEAEKELEELKKKEVEQSPNHVSLEPFDLALPRHHYSVGQVLWFISLVLSAAISLRASSEAMSITSALFGLGVTIPSWSSGRLWLLRLGYYKLTRAKEQAADWVWIVDHHIAVGEGKCLIILGVRLAQLPEVGQCLRHEDVEPIELFPVPHSDGKIVYQQLEKAAKKTGIPREIVADQGSDLKKGIEEFCQKHEQTSYVYDIKHATAAVLKRELSDDPAWVAFTRSLGQTKSRLQQTELAHLCPPAQRAKAQYMNIARQIEWGSKTLKLVDEASLEGNKRAGEMVEKLGWLREYRAELGEWGEMLEVVEGSEEFVRKQGLYQGAEQWLEKQLGSQPRSERAKKVRQELVAFVASEAGKATEGERLLGSSEVIESVIGKLKRVEGEPTARGMTSMILSVAAIVSKTSKEIVQKALAKVKTKKVLEWSKKNLGKTVQAKRKEAFSSGGKEEQKRDQLKKAA
jgi:hypothetical protein